jgi:hypothetical protein
MGKSKHMPSPESVTDTATGIDASRDDVNPNDKTDAKEIEYVVTPGRSICGTLKGIIDAGCAITPKCFRGDSNAIFRDLVERGDVVTKADYKLKLKEAAKK